MRAACIRALGGPEEIRLEELPTPTPGPHEALVEIRASPLDPVDALVRSGAFPTATPFPFVIGRDAVGTVVAAGPGSSARIGDRVAASSLGHDGRQGAWAEHAVVPDDRRYPAPPDLPDDELVTALHPGSTAHLALHRHGDLRPGESVLVGGGAGNVGGALVAEAARCGAHVVATARHAHAERVRSLGAHEVVDHSRPGAGDRLRELLGGRTDVVVDTSGRLPFDLLADLVAVRGRIVVIAAPPGAPEVPLVRLYTRDVSLRGFVMSRANTDELAAGFEATVRLLRKTPWRPRITRTAGLEQARALHEALDAHELDGRVLVLPSGDQSSRRP